MGRNAEPVDLILYKGRSHMGQEEIERRREQEVKVPWTDVEPPEYLTGDKLRAEFTEIAGKLQPIGIFTELDADRLAQYVLSRAMYNKYTARLMKMISKGDSGEVSRIQRLQNVAFNQCRACASDLGLSITSRCKLSVPVSDNEEDYEL